ncbi:LacI family DNA-binding transcriptional regulator [Gemmiger formicilis]|nr:LacI family DNA-binding transcriptional regulator [Gemmiger formicilis]
MTIKDIARESGYAVGTVSRVLNNNPASARTHAGKYWPLWRSTATSPTPMPSI